MERTNVNDSTKFQVDIIIRKFHKMKNEYINLKSVNNILEETVTELKKRLIKAEQQRCVLITKFKESISQNQSDLLSVQRENNHLRSVLQETHQRMEEYEKTISKLNEELEALRKKDVDKDVVRCTEQKADPFNQHHIKIHNDIKGSFDHPSFDNNDGNVAKRKQKKAKHPNFRWPNLDITINGEGTVGKDLNNSSLVDRKESEKERIERKRKLYCPVDDIIDLNEE